LIILNNILMLKKILKIAKSYKNVIIIIIVIGLLFIILFRFIDLFSQYIWNFLLAILKNKNIGGLFQGVGLALLTILIPLAISVFSSFIGSKRKEKHIETLVMIDYVLDIKKLIIAISFIFLPVLFWEESTITFRLLELSIWFTGMIILINQLNRVYMWIKSLDFQFYFLYLEKLKNKDEIEGAWNSIWQNKDMNFSDETQFLRIFSKRINILLKNKDG